MTRSDHIHELIEKRYGPRLDQGELTRLIESQDDFVVALDYRDTPLERQAHSDADVELRFFDSLHGAMGELEEEYAILGSSVEDVVAAAHIMDLRTGDVLQARPAVVVFTLVS